MACNRLDNPNPSKMPAHSSGLLLEMASVLAPVPVLALASVLAPVPLSALVPAPETSSSRWGLEPSPEQQPRQGRKDVMLPASACCQDWVRPTSARICCLSRLHRLE